jgi:mono/diheme cytochrome c family protein
MTINRIKLITAAIMIFPLMILSAFHNNSAVSGAPLDDASTVFKAKCAMCHGQTAEKKFDAAKADDVLIDTVMKGKADAKPAMPAYETKGMTKEEATALVALMKGLRTPPAE